MRDGEFFGLVDDVVVKEYIKVNVSRALIKNFVTSQGILNILQQAQ
jgi:hypothetical protein